MTAVLPGLETEADRRAAEPDRRDREDDPTPRELVRAILAAAVPLVMDALCLDLDMRALDVCAGYGCWASELRRWCLLDGVRPHITGVELCEARREHLRKWCDSWEISDWLAFMQEHHPLVSYDCILGNPPFATALVSEDGPEYSMPAILLEHAPAVLLYHTRNAFVRNEPGRAVWRAYPPARVFVIPGTVSHDGTSSVASDCYQASLWIRDHRGPTIEQLLDVEPKDANRAAGILKRNGEPYSCWRWRGEPPGSEEPSDDLPAAPGYVASDAPTSVVRGDS